MKMRGFLPYQWVSLCRLLCGLLCGLVGGGVGAQQLGDIEGKAKLSDAERAKRDADKVYQWIRFHADKVPAKPKPAPVAAAALAPAPKPLPRPAEPQVAVREVATPIQAPAPAGEPASAPAEPATALVAETVSPVQLAAASPVLSPPAPLPLLSAPPELLPESPPELPLQLLNRVEPDFPRQLLREVDSGSVLVRFKVAPDGSVAHAEAMRSSHRQLVRGTLDAVKRWRFAPIAQAREAMVEIGFRAE
jgi:TonB family protein